MQTLSKRPRVCVAEAAHSLRSAQVFRSSTQLRTLGCSARLTSLSPCLSSVKAHARSQVAVRSSNGETASTDTVKMLYINVPVPAKVYLAIEIGVLVGTLALVDAAYSGDWSRIGVISKSTELILQKVVLAVVIAHSVTAFLAARLATSRGLNPVWIAVKGFLFGSLEVNRVAQLPEIDGKSK